MGDAESVSHYAERVLDGKRRPRYSVRVNITEQKILIIGGSSGIGLATARASLNEGASVVIAGRSEAKLNSALANLNAPGRVTAAGVDIANEASLQDLFKKHPALNHIVVTAVDASYQPVTEFSLENLQRVINSKLIGAILVAKHGAKTLRAEGSMTFTSGIAADRPAPRGSAIAAVNGGLNSLVKALALELAPLRVNSVSPGWIDTPVWDSVPGLDKAKLHEAMAARLPVRRIGRPEEVAEAILFLIKNTFTTGTVLRVDGGHPLV